MDTQSLVQKLFGIARQCDDLAQQRRGHIAEAYGIAFVAIHDLAVELQQTKPRNTRHRVALSFGRETLVGLMQKYLEPARDELCTRVDGDYADRYLWPNDATKEMYERLADSVRGTAVEYSEFHPAESEALEFLSDAIWTAAQFMTSTTVFLKPKMCALCYRHTDPKSKSHHCLCHLRSSGHKSTAQYARGKRHFLLAVDAAKNGKLPEALRSFGLLAYEAFCKDDAGELFKLLKIYCPHISRKFQSATADESGVLRLVLQLGREGILDDPYVKNWVDYLDQRYLYIRGDKQYDPSKIQIRDPEKFETALLGLNNYAADHVCHWLVAAEVYLGVEGRLRRPGRPVSQTSKTQLVRDELSKEKLEKTEIAKKHQVSASLVYRVAAKMRK